MSRYTTALNLYLDGYARVAAAFKRSLQDTQRKTLVIAPGGRVIYFMRDDPVPSAFQQGIIGLFTKGCPTEVIEDALIHHMQTTPR